MIWDLGFQLALGAVAVDDDGLDEECSAGCRTQPAGRRRSPKPQGEEAQTVEAGVEVAGHSTPITSDALRAGRWWWVRLRQRLAYWLFARLDPELAALKLRRWHGRKDRVLRRFKRGRGTARPTAL